jgi:hypothetical protein
VTAGGMTTEEILAALTTRPRYSNRTFYLHCTNHLCECMDEDRPGWVCMSCGTPAVQWMTDEQFAEMEPID